VTISNGNDYITIKKSFSIGNAVNDVNFESHGFNEPEFRKIDNPQARFVGISENFTANVDYHYQLEPLIKKDEVKLQWSGVTDVTTIENSNYRNATVYYEKPAKTNPGTYFVDFSVSHSVSPQLFNYDQLRINWGDITYAVQGANISTNGGKYDNGTTVGYTGGDDRLIGTNETFTLNSISLHSELQGVVSNNLTNYNYNWNRKRGSGGAVKLTGQEKYSGTYKYLDSASSSSWVQLQIKHSQSDAGRVVSYPFRIK
jgi:hypothetical protein